MYYRYNYRVYFFDFLTNYRKICSQITNNIITKW